MKVYSIKNFIAVFVFTFSLALFSNQNTNQDSNFNVAKSDNSVKAFVVGAYLHDKYNNGTAEEGLAIGLVGVWESALWGFCFGGGVGAAVGV